MEFHAGHIVIRPHHGPASVLGTLTRVVRGKTREYLNHKQLDPATTPAPHLHKEIPPQWRGDFFVYFL